MSTIRRRKTDCQNIMPKTKQMPVYFGKNMSHCCYIFPIYFGLRLICYIEILDLIWLIINPFLLQDAVEQIDGLGSKENQRMDHDKKIKKTIWLAIMYSQYFLIVVSFCIYTNWLSSIEDSKNKRKTLYIGIAVQVLVNISNFAIGYVETYSTLAWAIMNIYFIYVIKMYTCQFN